MKVAAGIVKMLTQLVCLIVKFLAMSALKKNRLNGDIRPDILATCAYVILTAIVASAILFSRKCQTRNRTPVSLPKPKRQGRGWGHYATGVHNLMIS